MSWEDFVDQLRPLGAKMRERLPERLRDDPQTLAEAHRLLLAATMRAAADAIVGDRAHPMFVPELNIAQNIFQPNSDTIYKAALIEPGGRYRLRGDRGTIRFMRMAQLGPDTLRTGKHAPALLDDDFDTLALGTDGGFDVIVSPERPRAHTGDWWRLHPQAEKLMIRLISYDWGVEREPRIGIDRLDVAPNRPRLPAEELERRFAELPNHHRQRGNHAGAPGRGAARRRLHQYAEDGGFQPNDRSRAGNPIMKEPMISPTTRRCCSKSPYPSNAAIGRSSSPTKSMKPPTGTTTRAV